MRYFEKYIAGEETDRHFIVWEYESLADFEAYKRESTIADRAFHVRQIADYLESHGMAERAARLRELLDD